MHYFWKYERARSIFFLFFLSILRKANTLGAGRREVISYTMIF